VNRSEARGSELVRLLVDRVKTEARLVVWQNDFAVPNATDIVVNATSVGLFPDVDARLALDVSTLKAGMIVADVIPNPPRTRLVCDAEGRGCKVIDGLAMLVNQGVIGVKHWTGIDPDPAVMRKALEDVFAG
jgi:shikimate dehydrogenase